MKKNKKHQVELRDYDADMKALADAFFSYLVQVVSKRQPAGVWGIDPKWVLGKSGQGENALALEILETLGYEQAPCECCGAAASGPDATAIAYAMDLWDSLGSYVEERWHALHEVEAEHLGEGSEEEPSSVCQNESCGCETSCVTADESEDVVVEEVELEECDFCGGDIDPNEDHVCTCPDCGEEYDANDECGCENEEE